MAKTKTAYRWNADGWYFKSIENFTIASLFVLATLK